MTPLTQVVDCAMCGGRGVMLAERVPSGAERALHDQRQCRQVVNCPTCSGTGARIVNTAGWATVTVLLVCIFGSLLTLALIAAGQDLMCAVHDNTVRYCDGYVAGR